jgi:hypothetical protein
MDATLARMGDMRNIYRILVWKPKGKRFLGIPGHKWENIKIDLKETV